MIDVRHVAKRFGKFTAVADISFHVERNSIYGLVGYNGAGKTTLLKSIAGVYKPEEGDILVDGEPIFDNAPKKQMIFYVPDDLYFQPYASMERMAAFYRGYYPAFSKTTFEKLTSLFGLDKQKRISGFSKGMQRQAELVLGMASHADVLLLDESFDGLDPAKRNLTKQLLLEYMAEKEVSLIVSSHNLHELGGLCDHVGLINGKHLAIDCSLEEMSGSKCKFRMAFAGEVEEEAFRGIAYKRYTRDGRLISFIASGDLKATEQKLQAMRPILLESFPLSLEEIFMEEMEGTDYDISEIFQ